MEGPKQAAQAAPGESQQQEQLEDLAAEAGPIEDGILLARVHVPELCVSKSLQFPKDQLVWDVKQQCLASLPKVSPTPSTLFHFSFLLFLSFFARQETRSVSTVQDGARRCPRDVAAGSVCACLSAEALACMMMLGKVSLGVNENFE